MISRRAFASAFDALARWGARQAFDAWRSRPVAVDVPAFVAGGTIAGDVVQTPPEPIDCEAVRQADGSYRIELPGRDR